MTATPLGTSIEAAICPRVHRGSGVSGSSTTPVDAPGAVVDAVVGDAAVSVPDERSASTPATTTNATSAPTMTHVNQAGFNFVCPQARQEA